MWSTQLKTENYSSIIAIKNKRNPNDQFSFKPVTKEMIAKEISNLKSEKAVRSNDIPTKIIKDFKDLFATFIYNNYNKCLLDGTFPEDLKRAEVVLVHKKNALTKIITGLLAFYQIFQKFLKGPSTTKCMTILTAF